MPKELSDNQKRALNLLDEEEQEELHLKELRELTEEELYRLENEQYRFYEPNGKCEEYIKAVGNGAFITFFSAANGVGKTAASANIVANIVYEPVNDWFKGLPIYEDWKFPKRGRIVTDPNNVQNVVDSLKEWFPAGRYSTKKGTKSYEAFWTTDTGFTIEIMTYEQDPKEFEGRTLGFVWFDEPPTEAIYKACVARLRKGGIMFISATPLNGSAWLYDHIVANPDPEIAASGQRVHIEADVEAACKQHGVRGHLDHSNIERMIAEYTEDEKQARVHGKFQHLIGLRFKRFDRKIHIVKPFTIDPRLFTTYEALDTHPRNPDAAMWVAVDDKGRKFVCDELYIKCQNGTPELAQRIKEKAGNYRIGRRIIEPGAFNEDQHSEIPQETLAKKLAKEGLNYFPATKLREQADKRIEDALAFQKIDIPGSDVNGEFIKSPEIYIFDTCHRTIFELEHLRWDEWRGKTAENKDPKQKTVDKDDHMIECLGRILLMNPVFIPLLTGGEGEYQEPDYDPYAH